VSLKWGSRGGFLLSQTKPLGASKERLERDSIVHHEPTPTTQERKSQGQGKSHVRDQQGCNNSVKNIGRRGGEPNALKNSHFLHFLSIVQLMQRGGGKGGE